MGLLEQLKQRAQKNLQRIVLPEGGEPRSRSRQQILADKVANLILIGNAEKINKMAAERVETH